MNKKDFDIRTKVIRETFNDSRKIKCHIPKEEIKLDDDTYTGGDLFKTEDGDFIDLEFQMRDFDVDELDRYVEFAESLYEKHQRLVSIYIICPNDINVCVKECEIKSKADFVIKIACINEDPCEIILNGIKAKLENEKRLDSDDIHALSILCEMCRPEDKSYYRKEYFKIMNKIL